MLPEAQLNKTTELAVIRTIRCRSWHSLLSAIQAMRDRRWLVGARQPAQATWGTDGFWPAHMRGIASARRMMFTRMDQN